MTTFAMGLEHEMHFFHIPTGTTKGASPIDGVILYNAHEILTEILIKKYDDMTEDERKYARDIWNIFETSGRFCAGHWVIKGTGTKMPEFVTGDPFSHSDHRRHVADYVRELVEKESELIRFIRKFHPTIDKQIDHYGEVSNYPFGMSNYIKIPKSAGATKYIFEKTKGGREKTVKDYMGSYHITITLPHSSKTSLKRFIAMHQNFANQLQWIEPLLLPMFFSADDSSFNAPDKVKGSFRVMQIGWGNFAGTDVRKFAKGIGRYSNIKTYWRQGLDFKGTDKLAYCDQVTVAEPGAISALSSDFRTFGATDPKRPWHRESGAGMTMGNGVEFRIFDNFDYHFLYPLCKLITYVAENSRQHKTNIYVYQDPDWIETMHTLMRRGWMGEISKGYVAKVNRALGLRLKPGRADWVAEQFTKQLYAKCRAGSWVKLMLGRDTSPIPCPQVNRASTMAGFMIRGNREKGILKKYNRMIRELHKEKRPASEIYGEIFGGDDFELVLAVMEFDKFREVKNFNAPLIHLFNLLLHPETSKYA